MKNFQVLKTTPVIHGQGVSVRYKMGMNDDGFCVYMEQRFLSGAIHDGFLAQGVTLERANDIFERHGVKPFEKAGVK